MPDSIDFTQLMAAKERLFPAFGKGYLPTKDILRVALDKPLPGEGGDCRREMVGPVAERIFSRLLAEDRRHYERWQGGDDLAFTQDGYFRIRAEDLAKWTKLPGKRSVFRVTDRLKAAGLIDTRKPDWFTWEVRVRTDRVLEILDEIKIRIKNPRRIISDNNRNGGVPPVPVQRYAFTISYTRPVAEGLDAEPPASPTSDPAHDEIVKQSHPPAAGGVVSQTSFCPEGTSPETASKVPASASPEMANRSSQSPVTDSPNDPVIANPPVSQPGQGESGHGATLTLPEDPDRPPGPPPVPVHDCFDRLEPEPVPVDPLVEVARLLREHDWFNHKGWDWERDASTIDWDDPRFIRLIRRQIRYGVFPMTPALLQRVLENLANYPEIFSRRQQNGGVIDFVRRWRGFFYALRGEDIDRRAGGKDGLTDPDCTVGSVDGRLPGEAEMAQRAIAAYRDAGRYQARALLADALDAAENDAEAATIISTFIGVKIDLAEAQAEAKARTKFGLGAIDVLLENAETQATPEYRNLQVRAARSVLGRAFRTACWSDGRAGHWEQREWDPKAVAPPPLVNGVPSQTGTPSTPGCWVWRRLDPGNVPDISSDKEFRWVPDHGIDPSAADDRVQMLSLCHVMGLTEVFASRAKRYLPSIIKYPLAYYSCCEAFGMAFVQSSGVGDREHLEAIRTAKRWINRARAWQAIKGVHARN